MGVTINSAVCTTTMSLPTILNLTRLPARLDTGQTTHFIEAEVAASTARERSENALPERLHLRYATGQVIMPGRCLRRLAQLLQRGELENIRPLHGPYAELPNTQPIISSIVLTRKETV